MDAFHAAEGAVVLGLLVALLWMLAIHDEQSKALSRATIEIQQTEQENSRLVLRAVDAEDSRQAAEEDLAKAVEERDQARESLAATIRERDEAEKKWRLENQARHIAGLRNQELANELAAARDHWNELTLRNAQVVAELADYRTRLEALARDHAALVDQRRIASEQLAELRLEVDALEKAEDELIQQTATLRAALERERGATDAVIAERDALQKRLGAVVEAAGWPPALSGVSVITLE